MWTPKAPVQRAVITHAHADHARSGSKRYLAASAGEVLLRMRIGPAAEFQFLPYGEAVNVGGVKISFHPAGHILGSAQVRLEHRGRVAVVTGDYKLGDDSTCQSWEPIGCHLLVTESTFGLPVYRWRDQSLEFKAINDWWRSNQAAGKCSLLYAYAIGKSQRLLAGIDAGIGPIFTHGAANYQDHGLLRFCRPCTPLATLPSIIIPTKYRPELRYCFAVTFTRRFLHEGLVTQSSCPAFGCPIDVWFFQRSANLPGRQAFV